MTYLKAMMSLWTDCYLFLEDNLIILIMMILEIVKGLPLYAKAAYANFADFVDFFSGRSYDFWFYGVGCTLFASVYVLLVIYLLTNALLGCINRVFGLPYWIYACCFGQAEVQLESGSPQYCDASSNTTDFGSSSDLDDDTAPNQAYERMLEQQLENMELQNNQAEAKIEILKGALKKANQKQKSSTRTSTSSEEASPNSESAVESSTVPQEEVETMKAQLAWYESNYQQAVQGMTHYHQYYEAQQSQINSLLEEKSAWEKKDNTTSVIAQESIQDPESDPIVDVPSQSDEEAIAESTSGVTSPCLVTQEEFDALKAQFAITQTDLQLSQQHVAELNQYYTNSVTAQYNSLQTQNADLQGQVNALQQEKAQNIDQQINDLQSQLNTLQQEKLSWDSTPCMAWESTPCEVMSETDTLMAWPTFDEENVEPETAQTTSGRPKLIPCFDILPQDRASYQKVRGGFRKCDRDILETALVRSCLDVKNLSTGQFYDTLDQIGTRICVDPATVSQHKISMNLSAMSRDRLEHAFMATSYELTHLQKNQGS